MIKENAIHRLLLLRHRNGNTELLNESLDMAIEALRQPERKTGHWLDMGDFEQCSVCKCTQLKEFQTVYGKATWIKSPYCPNCGAKMEGVES